MSATLCYTASRQANAALGMARIAAAGRVQAEREAREARAAREAAAKRASFLATGTAHFGNGEYFCFICGRCTDHYAEHTEAQIAAWRTEYLRA